MRYVSTRGGAASVDFVGASLEGLAADGGLFTPEVWPRLPSPTPESGFTQTASSILSAFAGDALSAPDVRRIVDRAYAGFSHHSVAPLVEVGADRWMMELHHGPTLAFKDVAMQLIAQLYDHLLAQQGRRMTILCATSGDTGGAAAAAFAGSANIDIVILHPDNRISPTQRIFMTATGAANVHNLALDGDFDGTQSIIKALFSERDFVRRTGLAAVNSINWVRVAAQAAYFAQAQARLGADRNVRFVVPTGNFGDALAAYVAFQCGLLRDLDVTAAVNANDAVVRVLSTGLMVRGGAVATHSPAMDIQTPSNFERLLFDATGRDGSAVAAAYSALASAGRAELPSSVVDRIRSMGFDARRIDDAETLEEMRRTYAETGCVVCPHTAVGLAASRQLDAAGGPIVTLATAHAAKFPATVKQALDIDVPLPDRAAEFVGRAERYDRAPMDIGYVRTYVEVIAGERR